MVLNVHMNHKAYWGGGGEVDYIPIATLTVTTRMTLALRWAAMGAIQLMFH